MYGLLFMSYMVNIMTKIELTYFQTFSALWNEDADD